jgi:integrase
LLFMPSNITRRGTIYYFRARVPKDYVAAYGRTIVSLSLRTSDSKLALTRARERAIELERELQALREQASVRADFEPKGTLLHLADADIDALCARYRAAMLASDEVQRIKGLTPTQVEVDLDLYASALPSMRQAYAAGNLAPVVPNLQQFLNSIGVRVPRQSPAFNRLAARFQQTEIEVYDALLQRRHGVAVPIPVAPPDQMRLREVLDCWKSRSASRDPKTVRSFEQAFELFAAHCQVATARLIRKPDAVAFRNALLAGGKHSAVTISKLLSFLRAAFQAAVDDGLLELNPFDGVRVIVQETASVDKSRLPFSVEQLNRIFTGPIYRPDFVPRPSLGTACRWLPLLALFQGARLEELAQLEITDIGKDPKLGYFLRITNAGDRRLKTASSRRDIPVHPMLVELGFIDYVGKCKPGRLFPALRKDKYGRLGTQYSTWFGRYMDDLGLVDPQLVFNSFRHSFIEECKSKVHEGVPSEVREAMVGHLSPKQIEMTYGKAVYPLAPMSSAIAHVRFDGLDLRKVRETLPPNPRKQPRSRRRFTS